MMKDRKPQSIKEQLKQAVIDTMAMTQLRIKKYPKYSPLFFAKAQLELIKTMLENPLEISFDSISDIKIGLMAIKDIEDDDPEYADALCHVSGLLKKIATRNDSNTTKD